MSEARRRTGRPLAALGGVLLGWLALRLVGFGDPLADPAPAADAPSARGRIAAVPALGGKPQRGRDDRAAKLPRLARRPPEVPGAIRKRSIPAVGPAGTAIEVRRSMAEVSSVGTGPRNEADMSWSRLPGGAAPGLGDRWSGDAWLLVRGGAGAAPGGTFYGASQVGSVLRYRLVPASPHRPEFYLRGAAALAAAAGQDAAVGMGLRPLPRLPVRVGVEARVTRNRFATRLRPALVAVSELPPQVLPLGFVAEAYGQGGWIGGLAPEAFGDCQLRTEHPVGPAGPWQARLGGGLWAAGQRGATRVDLGPVASLTGRLGTGPLVRLELDWRQRAAGNAAPGSGPAVVLGASF